jgi:putative redox protein
VVFMTKLKANAKLLENVKLVTDNGRGHNVVCDLSEASGGTNAGPSPLELALMALAGCGVIIYADVCKNSKIDPGNIDIAIEAEKTANSPVISNVSMKVNIKSKARKSLVEAAWRRTEAACPVLFVYKENVPVKVETTINCE